MVRFPIYSKSFFDKVFFKKFAYRSGPTGLIGLLTNIKHSIVITTSDSPTWYLKLFKGNIIQNGMINATLKGVGTKKTSG